MRNILRNFKRAGANAAGRVVDNPLKTYVVSAVVYNTEIREHVLDLCAVKETDAADHTIGYCVAFKRVLKLVRLRVHTIQYGKIRPAV